LIIFTIVDVLIAGHIFRVATRKIIASEGTHNSNPTYRIIR